MKVGIIGSGLGGLLTGVSLLKKGHKVEIFERLPYPGGRFTNMDYEGYQLSTGALHMIPHGENGPLGRMLKSLGLRTRIAMPMPGGYFRINGKDYLSNELKNLFPFFDKIRASFILWALKSGSAGSESYEKWVRKRMTNPLGFQIADSFFGWTVSAKASDISAREAIAITKNIYKFRGPGVPIGGCKGVTDALVEEFENLGGKLFYKRKVDGISVENGRANGILADGNHAFDLVVSNVGPANTIDLCGSKNFNPIYVESIKNVVGTAGIKISIACEKPMLGHGGVLFTPQATRIDGLNEVTNVDPALAPEGKHLMMSHQALDPSQNVKKEIELGIKDLHEIFPDFKKHCKVLMAQTYRGNWPVNRSPSGTYIEPVSPIKGLYYVGDAIKPEGWMETEGVAAGVEIVIAKIEKSS